MILCLISKCPCLASYVPWQTLYLELVSCILPGCSWDLWSWRCWEVDVHKAPMSWWQNSQKIHTGCQSHAILKWIVCWICWFSSLKLDTCRYRCIGKLWQIRGNCMIYVYILCTCAYLWVHRPWDLLGYLQLPSNLFDPSKTRSRIDEESNLRCPLLLPIPMGEVEWLVNSKSYDKSSHGTHYLGQWFSNTNFPTGTRCDKGGWTPVVLSPT